MSAEILASARLEGTGLSPVVLHTDFKFSIQRRKRRDESFPVVKIVLIN